METRLQWSNIDMNKLVNFRVIMVVLVTLLAFTGRGQSISGIINNYYKVTSINTSTNTITLSGSAGLTPGSKVLIIQMKGASITATNTASFGNITTINDAGNYEMNEICGISGNDILFKFQLLKSYDPAGFVQLVTVPKYTSVTVTDTLKSANWDPVTGTGGVFVLEASGILTMNSPIDVSGKGFTGGALTNYTGCVWSTAVTSYSLSVSPADPNTNGAKKGEGVANFIANNEYARGKQANGGGGGNNHNAGGGGGSNIGTGGQGGNRSGETFFQCHGVNPGIGGAGIQSYGYTVPNNRVFMGGGGGAGHQNNFVGTPGGNGGGIILLKANTIAGVAAKLLANGGAPFNAACSNPYFAEGDGGGGGGAGGTILLDVQNFSGSFVTEAKGADGSVSGNSTNSCTGPGGGGGGGIVWVSGPVFPINVSTDVGGGAAGFISLVNSGGCGGSNNGATAGTAGTTLTNFTIPVANSFTCAPLPSTQVSGFYGEYRNGLAFLHWKLMDAVHIRQISIERSRDGVIFSAVGIEDNNATKYVDPLTDNGYYYYRLRIIDVNNKFEYSRLIILRATDTGSSFVLSFYPNPASGKTSMLLYSEYASPVRIVLYNQFGQSVQITLQTLQKGNNVINYDFSKYTRGVYFISVESSDRKQVIKVLVQR